MAKKIGIIVLLCFSLCVGGVSAFANEGHDETDTQTLIETQPPVSSVLFRQDGADIQQSTDEGKTWQSYSPIEETDYFTYDEFSAWIENETENIQKLVDAGEWTEAEATEALEYYDEILKSILEGKMVGKRASSSDDQLFFSMPDNAQPEQYQTFVEDQITKNRIDIVLSHTCPYKYEPRDAFLPMIDQSTVDDSTERWLDGIEEKVDYKAWLCGHWHIEKQIDKLRFLFHDVVSLEMIKRGFK